MTLFICVYNEMPRPIRVEYKNAYYYVTSAGRKRHHIFHDERYYECFIECLAEAHHRFGLEILSYSLLKKEYHLLVKTPEGNLGRAMRHINGVYTQRYNGLKNTNGSLFYGRYKAILVQDNSFQLSLTRFIHHTPVIAKLTTTASDYYWSSYHHYCSGKKPPSWLSKQDAYSQLGYRSRLPKKFEDYSSEPPEQSLLTFFSKKRLQPYLGDNQFATWYHKQALSQSDSQKLLSTDVKRPTIHSIVSLVSNDMQVAENSILKRSRTKQKTNYPRIMAIYLCHQMGGHKLIDIADAFDLKAYSSVSVLVSRFMKELELNADIKKKVDQLIMLIQNTLSEKAYSDRVDSTN